MPPSKPFFEQETGKLDTTQLLDEATPIAELIGLFAILALIPFAIVFAFLRDSLIGMPLVVLAQFILAVGVATVLLYVITRAIQLSNE
ncbi:hypothetical protein GL213_05490 [Halogeometricum borinquense]|uniref:Uncharacterized protein n=1 Tax=Halogeometricum borinquense TaxID=60847 RepID=A0A6C0UK75_9EURY|nr:hypothetical protein [Halogeometricum borinquense]QIB75003.1 hypothetical protein G3I44_12360 [Halogeometricum borinquense]QIQ76019.1 hypothetical protein GL213_05490 [Halogeometricum borinquense]